MTMTERQQSTALRKRQYLAEATQIIGERGYYGFGLQELAERCGITKAGLLHHFGSKDQLLIEVLRERDRHNSILIGGLLGPSDFTDIDTLTRQGMIDSFHEMIARSVAQPEMLRLYAVLSVEALNPRHPAHGYFEARDAAIREFFTQMIAPHVEAPRSAALHLLATMKGMEQEWLRTPEAFDLPAEWRAAVSRILDEPRAGDMATMPGRN